MIAAALGAAAIGEWEEGALLLFLFTLSGALEEFAMERTRRAIEALADLRPAATADARGGPVDQRQLCLMKFQVLGIAPDPGLQLGNIFFNGFDRHGTSLVVALRAVTDRPYGMIRHVNF